MQANYLLSEPTFYGRGEVLGLSAEDFIRRVEDFQANNTWTAAQTATQAVSYLRGPAQVWFNQSLKSINKKTQASAKGDFRIFKQVFIREFYLVKSSTDLSSDWHNLQQLDKETVRQFCARVFGSLNSYQTHMWEERDDPEEDVMEDFQTSIDGITAANATNNAKGLVAESVNKVHLSSAEMMLNKMIRDMGLKIVANGVRSPKLRELIIDQSRKKVDVLDIIDKAEHAEQASNKMAPNSNAKVFNSIPTPAKVSSVEDEEGDEVTAVTNKKGGGGKGKGKGGKGKGGGKGGNGINGAQQQEPQQQHQQQPRANNGDRAAGGNGNGVKPKPKYPCNFCEEMGHFPSECYLKRELIQLHRNRRGANTVDTVASYPGPSKNGDGWM